MDNWKILFGGVAGTAIVAIIGFLLERWLGSKERPSGQLTAQGAKVENSPVASGSNIAQTLDSPTVNISVGSLAPRAAVAERAALARTSPNIVRKAVRQARLRQYPEVWAVGGEFDEQGFIVTFKNEAQADRTNVGAHVKAHIILQDEGGAEHTSFTGQWLEQASGVAEFRVDDTRTLIIGLIRADEFCGLENLRVQHTDGASFTTRVHSMPDHHRWTVAVRLTDANRGDVLYEGKFRLTAQPLSIEALS